MINAGGPLRWVVLMFCSWTCIAESKASETLSDEAAGKTYHFTTHYRSVINASPQAVWAVLIDLQAWMYEFELATETGMPGQPGQILNLYSGQDFKLQVIASDPPRMLVLANLPLTFQGEFGTGVGVFTLHKQGDQTEVALTGTRRYAWRGDGVNPLRQRRAEKQFQQATRRMWQRRFLGRLKQLVEVNTANAEE
ncbi:MAG: SRPBCC family protein [Pseudomonadota bacterium]